GHKDEPIKMRMEVDKFDGKPSAVVPASFQNIYQSLIENHAASVQSGKRLCGCDGRHNLLLCEAAHKSAQNGGKIITVKD
ncbi:MAG: hypothetical protein IJH79_16210, partial [Lentisphaeria bacterium]|nr:hypothetical protein [Lentisphaeria bacterium]